MITKQALETFKKAFREMHFGKEKLANFQEGEKISVGVWGMNITIFDLEEDRLYRLISQSPPFLREVLFRGSCSHKESINQLLFGSSASLSISFRELTEREVRELVDRMLEEGIESVPILGYGERENVVVHFIQSTRVAS